MGDPKKQTFHEFIADLSKQATRVNAGTGLASFKRCGAYQGGSVYILFVAKDAEPIDAVRVLIESMTEDDE
jgi:hypothetical protein